MLNALILNDLLNNYKFLTAPQSLYNFTISFLIFKFARQIMNCKSICCNV